MHETPLLSYMVGRLQGKRMPLLSASNFRTTDAKWVEGVGPRDPVCLPV